MKRLKVWFSIIVSQNLFSEQKQNEHFKESNYVIRTKTIPNCEISEKIKTKIFVCELRT